MLKLLLNSWLYKMLAFEVRPICMRVKHMHRLDEVFYFKSLPRMKTRSVALLLSLNSHLNVVLCLDRC